MKNQDLNDPNKVLEAIHKIENSIDQPLLDLMHGQDVKLRVRLDEKVGPAMFKSDPLIPGGYVANSLTIRAMRPDIFVLGDSIEDLSAEYHCACNKTFDVQFWKICPYCGSNISTAFLTLRKK